MNILQILTEWDQTAFQWINSGLGNPVFDALLPWFRDKWFWTPLYLFISSFIILNFRKKSWLIILGLVLAAGLSDFTSSTLVKKNVRRVRPCNDVEMQSRIVARAGCGGGYSFTSSHASNHFAVAVYLSSVLAFAGPWVRRGLLLWATSIAFSQVYVGVHYPGDVLIGALLGALIGWLVIKAFEKWAGPFIPAL